MGMFDSVFIRCPACGTRHEAQSKTGPCRLGVYYLENNNTPADVLGGVMGQKFDCSCGVSLEIEVRAIGRVRVMR